MNQHEDLLKYLYAAQKGGFGWKDDYIKQFSSESWAWRAGFFEGLLNDLISIIGLNYCIKIMQILIDAEANLTKENRLNHCIKVIQILIDAEANLTKENR